MDIDTIKKMIQHVIQYSNNIDVSNRYKLKLYPLYREKYEKIKNINRDYQKAKTGAPNTVNISKNGVIDHFDADGNCFQSTFFMHSHYVVCKYFVGTEIIDIIHIHAPNSPIWVHNDFKFLKLLKIN